MITPAMTFPNMTRLARLRSWRLLLALLLAGTATFASAQERPRRAPAPQSEQHPETRPPEQRAGGHARQRAAAAAAGFGDRAHHRHPRRQARLHRDRRDAVAVRSIRRAVGGDLLHRLCRQQRRGGEPPRHLRLQRRSGRGIGVSEPRPGRAENPRVSRQRRRDRALAGQSADLARLHRSGDDRSGRNRLEPAGQGRRRQRVLWRAPGCANAGQDHRALPRQERPRQLAQISSRRKLRRVSRRQGGAGAAARPGHHGVRHRDGVTADRGRVDLRRQPVRARRRIAAAVAGSRRA